MYIKTELEYRYTNSKLEKKLLNPYMTGVFVSRHRYFCIISLKSDGFVSLLETVVEHSAYKLYEHVLQSTRVIPSNFRLTSPCAQP